MGLALSDRGVEALFFGHATRDEVQRRLVSLLGTDCIPTSVQGTGPTDEVVDRLQRYASGEAVNLADVPTCESDRTPFQQRVLQALKRVGYGQTLTYAELAAAAGSPRAARAVGTVMASNRVPLIIPCHRVVAAAGRLGGFSAPRGVELKRYLLRMEAGETLGVSFM